MKVMAIYEEKILEAFKRAEFCCKKEGLRQIETLFLVRELLKEGYCELYEFFQDMEINDSYIDSVMRACIRSTVCRVERDPEEQKEGKNLIINSGTKSFSFYISKELAEIMEGVLEAQLGNLIEINPEEMDMMEKTGVAILIDINDILNYIVYVMPIDMAKFIRRLDLKVSDVVEDFFMYVQEGETILDEDEQIQNVNVSNKTEVSVRRSISIPDTMKSFLRDLTSELDNRGKKLILGRDKETRQLWNIISKKNKRNAVLVGEPGVGKTAIVYKLVQDISNRECPEKFQNYSIISLDMTGIIAGTSYRGQAEERFKLLNTFLEKNRNVILFIDEIHNMLGAGSCREGELDLANSMKPILARGDAIVIGATTTKEYEKYFSSDGALKRRFEKIEVEEPSSEEIYPMLKNKIKDLEDYHGVHIKKDVVDFVIFTASCFNYETKNPDRTLDLLDRSMVNARRSGKGIVDKKSVLANFNINFERFQKMSFEEKRATAYHEAGHFVVHEMSGLLKDHSTVAVSIMPADYYLGINVYENTDETISPTMDYYIDSLAVDLAGREAERIILSKDNSGVASDLEAATKTAYKIVTKFGMIEGYDISYINANGVSLINEKEIDRINKSIQDLLKKAEKRAREILEKNKELLVAVAEELLKKKMLSKKDLNKIIHKVNHPVNK